ncbi:MAG: hypothetical protein JWM47_4535 [Acidimicrobiales bacterium]|nr:hypothetical protein [Acidimicrobiales bacterium]
MISVQASETFQATLDGAPTGLVGTLGVRIEDADATILIARATTGIVEVTAGSGIYLATVTAPGVPSPEDAPYVVLWDTGGDDPIYAEESLVVGALEDGTLRPTVAEVALLLRTRTTGGLSTGLGGDTSIGDVTTFTDVTRPSATEVERVITIAYGAVLGELSPVAIDDIPVAQTGQVRHAIALYTAIMIETSFFREQADEASLGIWRDLYAAAIGRISGAMTPDGRSRRMVSATLESPYSGTALDELPDLPL